MPIQSEDRSGFAALRVALVDDSPHLCKLVELILSAFGVRHFRAFTDALDALTALAQDPPDLLLCDWQMRPVDGPTLIRAIRRHDNPALAKVPVVVISGHPEEEHRAAARAAEIDDWLVKPVTPQALYDCVAAAASRSARAESGAPAAGAGAGRPLAPMP